MYSSRIFHQERLGFKHINVGEIVAQHKCYNGRDEELDTNILDEDELLDAMETIIEQARDDSTGIVADFYACELFPERWFDLVLVLRADTNVLFDRLTARGYSERKRSENVTSEIMQVVLEEAREAYDANIVHDVPSNTLQDMESNVQRVESWTKQWITDHADDVEE
jgi:adenylate kinase